MKFICLLSLFYLPIIVMAQDNKKPGKTGLEIIIFAGGQTHSISGLNQRLQSLSIDPSNKFLLNFGFGSAFRFNNFIIGGEAEFSAGTKKRSKATGAHGKFYLSTNAIGTGHFIFSPQIGIGIQQFTHRFTAPSSNTNFDFILMSNRNQAEIVNIAPVADIAIMLKSRAPKSSKIFPFVRVGYRYSLKESRWEILETQANDGPLDRINGFYVQLILGRGN